MIDQRFAKMAEDKRIGSQAVYIINISNKEKES